MNLLVGVAILGATVGVIGVEPIKQGAFYVGRYVSLKFTNIPYWETTIEPAIIRGSDSVSHGINGFINGLASDNKDENKIELREIKKEN